MLLLPGLVLSAGCLSAPSTASSLNSGHLVHLLQEALGPPTLDVHTGDACFQMLAWLAAITNPVLKGARNVSKAMLVQLVSYVCELAAASSSCLSALHLIPTTWQPLSLASDARATNNRQPCPAWSLAPLCLRCMGESHPS